MVSEALEKCRSVLEEKTDVESRNRGFQTDQHSVCTHKQNKNGVLYYFYTTRIVLSDRVYKKQIFLSVNFRYFISISFFVNKQKIKLHIH